MFEVPCTARVPKPAPRLRPTASLYAGISTLADRLERITTSRLGLSSCHAVFPFLDVILHPLRPSRLDPLSVRCGPSAFFFIPRQNLLLMWGKTCWSRWQLDSHAELSEFPFALALAFPG